jgi:hypothetical protein
LGTGSGSDGSVGTVGSRGAIAAGVVVGVLRTFGRAVVGVARFAFGLGRDPGESGVPLPPVAFVTGPTGAG